MKLRPGIHRRANLMQKFKAHLLLVVSYGISTVAKKEPKIVGFKHLSAPTETQGGQ